MAPTGLDASLDERQTPAPDARERAHPPRDWFFAPNTVHRLGRRASRRGCRATIQSGPGAYI
jgi:hypothetical protein